MGCLPSIPIYFKDCGTACVVSTTLVSCHTVIIEAPALAAVMPDSRDLGILTQVGCVVYNKEYSYSSIVDDSFNVVFPVRN
jgi:hypothetical protein